MNTLNSSKLMLLSLGLMLNIPSLSAAQTPLDAVVELPPSVELAVPVSGVVRKVHVRVGDAVTTGKPLISLDGRDFQSAVSAADARVAQAEPRANEMRRELERAEELYARTVLSDHDLKLAEIADSEAQAGLALAKAQRSQARLDAERAVLRAPFDLVVTAVKSWKGQVVVNRLQAQTLIEAYPQATYRLRANVSADQFAALSLGDRLSAADVGAEIRVVEKRYRPDQVSKFVVIAEATRAADRLVVGQRISLKVDQR